jgi:hypothetical protein
MPKRVTPLTDLQVRSARTREKAYKLADGGGLYLEVTSAGTKLWRLKYRQLNGKENKLHFSAYPDVSLGVARDLHGKMIKSWQPQTAENMLHRFELDLFPVFGSSPIADIKVPAVLNEIRAVEGRGCLGSGEAPHCGLLTGVQIRDTVRAYGAQSGRLARRGAGTEGKGPIAFNGALQEALDTLVDHLAQARDLALGDAAHAHGLDELVDRACRDALDIGFLDNGRERLLRRSARFQ